MKIKLDNVKAILEPGLANQCCALVRYKQTFKHYFTIMVYPYNKAGGHLALVQKFRLPGGQSYKREHQAHPWTVKIYGTVDTFA